MSTAIELLTFAASLGSMIASALVLRHVSRAHGEARRMLQVHQHKSAAAQARAVAQRTSRHSDPHAN